ncbi:TerF vWA domain-containing protein [Paenibacillus tianmuensis]|uniref:TerF vWA domain-containing protein n=1 Tax=Paenibacillus tianmuensis TaxID=624147 RepID=A0A1G4QKL6_9BACL|nr:VWA domain-containing protein [Paenibacillus tianmuensis]SCW44619.1 TerF vWA domain-containing protein [Paenibacillus tianmuensis]
MSINLLKQNARIVLEKKNLTRVQARVGLVLDGSGSMRPHYKSGVVQKVIERILAIATQFDDDGSLDCWIYDHNFSRLSAATEHNVEDYVERNIMNNATISKFGRNDEPPVMRDVIKKFTVEEPSALPAYIVFINDGGVKRGKGDTIDQVVVDSSSQPLFWQFVGIGNSDFGVLKKLDTIEGRVIDNANFFQINDIENIQDHELYDLLLNEFPDWLKAAEEANIIRG